MAVDFSTEIYTKYRENKLSHAYLIETNNLDETYNKVLELCKKLECSLEYSKTCEKCNICNLINLNNHPNVYTIEPDGINIKKEQIINLKEKFSTMPVYSKYNIYIIKGAEKLNESSENSLLKFLEEPEENILGFLLTENKDKLLSTVVSRCQAYQDVVDAIKQIVSEDIEKLGSQYFELFNSNNCSLLLANKTTAGILKDKDVAGSFFNTLLKKYLDKYKKEQQVIDLKRLAIIQKNVENLKFNVNIELLLDKFVIEMSELNEEYL